eukprot:CAMPEP_0178637030 /NCGR_PEP_ID=MMETSP0698-20121128/14078_1 /TAXON_ID=265572 /ORGANISM="Extubocellulus spinifer, Strain CCMP396" /LENGTH=451 /DNA_ID=CAMNT_0020277001 /DNA_START=78 /DNA_END=1433 /DNA_ORIENTATION=-
MMYMKHIVAVVAAMGSVPTCQAMHLRAGDRSSHTLSLSAGNDGTDGGERRLQNPINVPSFALINGGESGDSVAVTAENLQDGNYGLSIRSATDCESPILGITWDGSSTVTSATPVFGSITQTVNVDFVMAAKTALDTDEDEDEDSAQIKFCVIVDKIETQDSIDHVVASKAGVATLNYNMEGLSYEINNVPIQTVSGVDADYDAFNADGSLTIEGFHCDDKGDELFNTTILPYEEVHYCVRPVRAGFLLEEITTLTLEWQKSDGTTTTTVSFDAIVDGAAYSSIINSIEYENDIGRAHLNFLPIDVFRDGDIVSVKGTALLAPKARRDLEESELDLDTPSMEADGDRRLDAATPAKFATLLAVDSTGIDQGSNPTAGIIAGIACGTAFAAIGCILIVVAAKKRRRREEEEEEEEDEARRRHPEYPEMNKMPVPLHTSSYGRKLSSTSSESV